ncbi:Asp-tRNA(Asn)/Glu-tRNA(Gln) amidotransferase subunit GatB [Methylococcus sp. EFPC2]|uniref:Asp-tRNA(Asn)/Glu-tRNA(Gln) amidotransferase subunit GatB n=1 Tax=Methylococcus sp. EFPC2 TaxID=2812648 RepID=UPI001967F1A5|nr:Asp-tRNA(Asn)/Glu-tRNA(Gln) amidotransferase subunit GatB [Methylococcus sp. EFPC2]QSA96141.1 Asp-tRNA(Asn)/Glu-tRNA(Gln) amidotransferase subunit GatB [Methylococcus sp. EFPC2]
MEWETVIGLEVHAQLATKSKIFSAAATAFGAEPNTQACAVDLGLPGVLPVLNAEAVRMAVKFGLAIGAHIAPRSVFARKNYFYPDLPKGYQISQYDLPVVGNGHLDILVDGEAKTVGITRAHLEEDAGKSLHEDFHGLTGIDLNRAGTPLLEIVSEPDLRSAKEAVAYLKKLHALVRYLEICDGNMQEGSFRCDANVSVRPKGQKEFGTRAEIKNVNSFRFVEKAINYEIERQIELIESGGQVVQETRLYDANKDETRSMRTKEEANDYRYFPDPDLLPLEIHGDFIAAVKQGLPELPDEKRDRFESQYGLNDYDATVLTATRELADYYEAVVEASNSDAKLCANWVMGDLSAALNKAGLEIDQSPVDSVRLAGLVQRIADDTISGKIAKQVFEALWESDKTADAVIEEQGLKQITDTSAIEAIIDQIIAANPDQVTQYRAGKDKLFGFFVGQAMKATGGKANPGQLNDLLKAKLQA